MAQSVTNLLLLPAAAAALAMAAWTSDAANPTVETPADAPLVETASSEAAPTGAPPGDTGDAQAPDMIPAEIQARIDAAKAARGSKPGDLPKFDTVGKDYKKVVSTADGAKSLYTIWTREKDGQMLAELPRNFASQKLFIAYTVAGGTTTSGVQTGDRYAYWKRFDKRLALIEPNFAVKTTGDLESQKGRDRVFTDRVILDVPIAAMGPGGGPVIDMDRLLIGQASRFFGGAAMGANPALARIAKAKAFPSNVELAFELPMAGGRFGTLHYSFAALPKSTGYKSRKADARVGYFTTTHRDIGHPSRDTPYVRYVNRWKVEKADPKLRLSPPKEPIVFYLEHTVPVRYRRWVRDGVLEWNKAFEKVGIVGAVEVYQQDARTGTHMEKDPEDARFNFILWTNSGMGFAIGPSRVDPRTGQILDADVVMDEGFISGWVNAWQKIIPEAAMENFGPETLAWLQTRPQWDPRVRLAAPAERADVIRRLARDHAGHDHPFAGHPAVGADPALLGDDRYDGLAGRISQVNGRCEYGASVALELALFRMGPDLIAELARRKKGEDEEKEKGEGKKDDEEDGDRDEDEDEDEDEDQDVDEGEKKPEEQMLDGIPEWFVGPMLRAIVMHEVGHTLGLRHNFKASTVYGLDEINSEAFEGRAMTGSVMDYNPININFDDGDVQGPYTMLEIGPYDYWAIEYGYTLDKNLAPILKRCTEPELIYGTDEDSWGSDPSARTFDLGANPLDYADSQMRLVTHLRGKIVDRMVKDGEGWAKARQGYELLLSKHMGAISIAANWIGGTHVNRDRKGDPGDREPVTPVGVEQQRRALDFVVANAFDDDAYGLTPELLARMSLDKWFDGADMAALFEDPAWPVHQKILAIQASTMTMLMNPTTMIRVYDNEFRVDPDEDALTLPELIWGVTDEVWSELDETPNGRFTNRQPMISSLRRNLQREQLERLIDLSLPNRSLGVAAKPVSTLSTHKLRDLEKRIGKLVDKRGTKLDDYTLAHLGEARVLINRALEAQFIYNTDDMRTSSVVTLPFFMQERETAGDR